MTVTNVAIKQRVDWRGRPFSELFISFIRDGTVRVAYSRMWWIVPDTPEHRAFETQQFIRRQSR